MTVEIADPAVPVSVTPAAAAHFRQRLERDQANGIRISVKESGCTGYMYEMDLVDKASGPDDIVIDLGEGHSVFVDASALTVMRGTVIDYVSEGLNRVLRFNNPNAQDYCGCGESFSIQGENA